MNDDNELMISIYSFGFHKSGIPEDESGNNGGFVFDCRALPNPGREALFARKTGLDREVIGYLEKENTVHQFLHHALALIKISAKNYRERKFSHLMVSFGCTGGQHRSVYCAEKIAAQLKSMGYHVRLIHIDKPDFEL